MTVFLWSSSSSSSDQMQEAIICCNIIYRHHHHNHYHHRHHHHTYHHHHQHDTRHHYHHLFVLIIIMMVMMAITITINIINIFPTPAKDALCMHLLGSSIWPERLLWAADFFSVWIIVIIIFQMVSKESFSFQYWVTLSPFLITTLRMIISDLWGPNAFLLRSCSPNTYIP